MLADSCRQLLTAYVDGELTSRQRKLVLRLLSRSPEARQLLQKLQHDAEALRRLPRQRLGPDFARHVVQAIESRPLRPAMRHVAARWAGVPAWVGWAAAAAILVAIGLGSYFFFAQPGRGPVAWDIPPILSDPKAPDTQYPRNNGPAVLPDATARHDAKQPNDTPQPAPGPVAKNPTDAPPPDQPSRPDVLPDRNPNDPLRTTRFGRPKLSLEVIRPKLPLVVKMRDLDRDALRAELGRDSAFRLELPIDSGGKALERLRAALRTNDVTVTVDKVAKARLNNTMLRHQFVVYSEDLTADEWINVLLKLAGEDKKAKDALFEGLVLAPLTGSDRQELVRLTGADLKPLPASGNGKPSKVERSALAVPYGTDRPMTNTSEIRDFLTGRKPLRPGAIQLMVVLRDVTE